METKTSSKTGEMFTEGSKIANKWFSDYASVMTDIFNKQMKMVSGFYGNLFRMFSDEGNKAMQQTVRFPDWMQAGNPFLSAFYGNGNGHGSGTKMNGENFMSGFNSFISQMNDANLRMLNTFNQSLVNTDAWKDVREKYESFMEDQYESTKKIMDAYADTYRKQIDFANEINRTLLETVSRQMNDMVQQSQDFWNEIGKTYSSEPNATKRKSEEKSQRNFKTEGIVVS